MDGEGAYLISRAMQDKEWSSDALCQEVVGENVSPSWPAACVKQPLCVDKGTRIHTCMPCSTINIHTQTFRPELTVIMGGQTVKR